MFRIFLLFLLIVFFVGCSEPYIDSPEPKPKLSVFTHFGIPPTKSDRPTIAHINIVDLDQNGFGDVLVCDVSGHQVSWIQDNSEKIILRDVDGPVHAETIDIDSDGDLDVLIAAKESFAMAVQLQPTFSIAKEALLKLH